MRKLTLFVAAALAAISAPALATARVNPPTLHGFCSLGNVCTDNNTNTPTAVNPPVFAFSASPGPATGTLWIDILVPNNIATLPTSFTISPFTTSTLSGTATQVGTGAWTSGFLDAFLGLPQTNPPTTSPANPIGAYLPATQGFQPTATGFFVFQANLGTTTLLDQGSVGQSGQDAYLMQLGQTLLPGSYILGFLSQGSPPQYGATANSGPILVTGPPGVPEPATWAMMLLGFGATGVAVRRSRRRKALLEQIA